MTPAFYLFPVQQYSHLELPLFLTDDQDVPINLTGYQAWMQVRTLTGAVALDLSTANGGLVLGGRSGMISIIITTQQSANPLLSGLPYDLMLIPPSGQGFAVMTGKILLNKGVTHG